MKPQYNYLKVALPVKLAWHLERKATARVLHIAKEEKVEKEPLNLCHDALVELFVYLRGLLLHNAQHIHGTG